MTFLVHILQTILDMTFGAGGHSRALLSSLPECTILALDRDPAAYSLAQKLAAQRYTKSIQRVITVPFQSEISLFLFQF